MPDYDVSFNDLPEKTFENIENGIYILKWEDIIKEEDDEYGSKYTITHDIVGTGRKVNFDNYKLFNADGSPHVFGQGKLRKLLIACGLDNLEKINVKVLKAVGPGKLFKAELRTNDKGYTNIHFSEIFPIDDPRIALNEEAIKTKSEEVAQSPNKPTVSKDVAQDTQIDDDDI